MSFCIYKGYNKLKANNGLKIKWKKLIHQNCRRTLKPNKP